jgi:hypothetical protein
MEFDSPRLEQGAGHRQQITISPSHRSNRIASGMSK